MRRTFAAVTLFFALMIAAPSMAQESTFKSTIPDSAIAWWRLDPSRFAANQVDPAVKAQRQVVIAGLRAAVASGVIVDTSAARTLEALLAASEVGGRKHTLCLLELDAERSPDGTGMSPRTLRMVLELETGTDHASILRSVRAILVGDAKGPDQSKGVQRELKLPGGVTGVAFREADWAPWREISWASTERSFVIGLGRGALEQWFAAQDRQTLAAPNWAAHEQQVDSARSPGVIFFSAYMNLDRIRVGFPEAFVEGRTKRVLDAVNLSNARDVMLHGRWISAERTGVSIPMIAADITWSARSELPGVVQRRAISEESWPASLRMSPPPGSYLIVLRADWALWTYTALDLVPAASRTTSTWRRTRAIRRWLRTNDLDLRRFLANLEPWLVLSDVPTPVTPMPGATTFFAPLKRGVSAQEASEAFQAILSVHAERLANEDGVWWFQVDPAGILRIPAWGFVGPKDAPIMVGGWGPPVVTENRKRLGDPLK